MTSIPVTWARMREPSYGRAPDGYRLHVDVERLDRGDEVAPLHSGEHGGEGRDKDARRVGRSSPMQAVRGLDLAVPEGTTLPRPAGQVDGLGCFGRTLGEPSPRITRFVGQRLEVQFPVCLL